MSTKKLFRYKRGNTEIESDVNDIHARRLASIDTKKYWEVKTIYLFVFIILLLSQVSIPKALLKQIVRWVIALTT